MINNFLKGKHILVTGGTGFIGHHLVKQLMQQHPAHLYVLDDLSTGQEENIAAFKNEDNFSFIQADVASPKSTESINTLDYIFHLAAVVSVPKSFEQPFHTHRTNESGFINMLELSRRLNVKKIIYASSSAVYGEQKDMPILETAILKPLSPYGLSKLLNEQYAAAFYDWEGISSVGFRFFNVYGPGQRADSPYSGVISIFTERMQQQNHIAIFGDGEQIRDFVYVEDVVQALILGAASSIDFGLYNVGSGKSTNLNQLFATLKAITAYPQSPEYKEARKGDIEKSTADISLIKEQLGYKPKFELKEGLAKLLAVREQ